VSTILPPLRPLIFFFATDIHPNPQNRKLDFFKTFTPIFTLYERFSRVQPVPGFGVLNATKAEVEGFYDFWYNFDSWRSFEWWDKEVNEGSDRYGSPCPPFLGLVYV